ncbi:hypothetical protein ACQPW1_00045 [Nocardia sp. CA-128927]
MIELVETAVSWIFDVAVITFYAPPPTSVAVLAERKLALIWYFYL